MLNACKAYLYKSRHSIAQMAGWIEDTEESNILKVFRQTEEVLMSVWWLTIDDSDTLPQQTK